MSPDRRRVFIREMRRATCKRVVLEAVPRMVEKTQCKKERKRQEKGKTFKGVLAQESKTGLSRHADNCIRVCAHINA